MHLSTDEGVQEAVETSELTNDIENNILRQMSGFLGSHPTASTVEVEENKVSSCRLLEPSEEEEGKPGTQKQRYHIAVADAATSTEQLPLNLSPRQLALWNEYCRLVGWKDYFYQAWWNTTQEYEAVLTEFRKVASQINRTEM